MKRLQRAAVLLTLVENLKKNGSWCGETHIQKAVYFLQELLCVPLGYEFILYKHGPFSFELSDDITGLRADAIFQIRPQPFPYGPSIVPGRAAESLKANFSKTILRYKELTEFVATKLGEMGVTELERVATALYVESKKGKDKHLKELAFEINKLKTHISLNEAQSALEFVNDMRGEAQKLCPIS